MKIEERAIEFQRTFRWTAGADNATNMLVKFATEQHEIDIQRAVEWLKNNAERYIFETEPKYGSYGDILTCIDNRMYDDFKQAMKEE